MIQECPPLPEVCRTLLARSPRAVIEENRHLGTMVSNSVSARSLHIIRLPHVGIMGDFRYGLTAPRDIIRAGTPITVQLLGTSPATNEFGHTTTLSPIVTGPNTLLPAPKNTLLPIVGLCSPRMVPMLT